MRPVIRAVLAATFVLTVGSSTAQAQQPPALVADLLTDVSQVEEKLVGLARAMPEATYGWRPGEGVRSVTEVFQHVAADNYLIPAAFGVAPPAATGIKPDEYATVQAYERRKADRAAVIADLERSFAHLKQAMTATPPGSLGESVTFFGQSFTKRQLWIITTTHLHEHLGQAIAYARSNGIVPPWSRSGGDSAGEGTR